MRKPKRAAAVILATMVAFPLHYVLAGPVSAEPNPNDDRTDSEAYTEARADYWQARADYYARKEATRAMKEAGEDVPNGALPPNAGALPPLEGFDPFATSAANAQVQPSRLTAPTAPTTTAPPPPPAALAEGVPTNAQLAALRMCESTDRYWINTGNGYYGAYQFSAVTWWWLGYAGWPHEAPPHVQDQAVRDLYAIFGWTPWPACSRLLGFR